MMPVEYGILPDPPADIDERDRPGPLTSRQVKVLQLIAEGKSNKEIADELGLAAGTIKMHLSRIYKALGAKSRTDALAKYTKLQQDAG